MPPSAWARTRKASHIGADMNHLCPVSSYSAPGPPPFSGGRRWCWPARPSRPASRSSPSRPGRPACRGAGRCAGRSGRGEAGLPLLGELGLMAQRRDRPSRSSRSGSRRPASAWLKRMNAPRGRRGRRAGVLARAASGARADREPSSSCQAGWNRPRRRGCRSDRGCGASAGSRWPRGPSSIRRSTPAAPNRRDPVSAPSRRPRGTASSGRGRSRRGCSRPAAAAGW